MSANNDLAGSQRMPPRQVCWHASPHYYLSNKGNPKTNQSDATRP
jgi:hypothetical protein